MKRQGQQTSSLSIILFYLKDHECWLKEFIVDTTKSNMKDYSLTSWSFNLYLAHNPHFWYLYLCNFKAYEPYNVNNGEEYIKMGREFMLLINQRVSINITFLDDDNYRPLPKHKQIIISNMLRQGITLQQWLKDNLNILLEETIKGDDRNTRKISVSTKTMFSHGEWLCIFDPQGNDQRTLINSITADDISRHDYTISIHLFNYGYPVR